MNTHKLVGKVKFYDQIKKFGFIRCDELQKDVFFHSIHLVNRLDILIPEDRVCFELGENQNGECAINVERL